MFATRKVFAALIAAGVLLASFIGTAHADPAKNKELVIKAMTGVFIDQDPSVVEKYWSENYIQRNPMFPNGREVVANFAENPPEGFKYEMGAVLAEGDLVIVRGRYTGFGPKPLIGADMFRIEDGKIVEHWDILQEEVPAEETKSGNPMFEPGM